MNNKKTLIILTLLWSLTSIEMPLQAYYDDGCCCEKSWFCGYGWLIGGIAGAAAGAGAGYAAGHDGSKGRKGGRGETGPTGPTGPTGSIGSIGNSGPSGPTGPTGPGVVLNTTEEIMISFENLILDPEIALEASVNLIGPTGDTVYPESTSLLTGPIPAMIDSSTPDGAISPLTIPLEIQKIQGLYQLLIEITASNIAEETPLGNFFLNGMLMSLISGPDPAVSQTWTVGEQIILGATFP